jgi:hypothetical protein
MGNAKPTVIKLNRKGATAQRGSSNSIRFWFPDLPNQSRFVKGLSNSQCAIDSCALREQNPNTLTRRRFYVAVFLSVSNDISCIPVA